MLVEEVNDAVRRTHTIRGGRRAVEQCSGEHCCAVAPVRNSAGSPETFVDGVWPIEGAQDVRAMRFDRAPEARPIREAALGV